MEKNEKILGNIEGTELYNNLFPLSNENDAVMDGFTQKMNEIEWECLTKSFESRRLKNLKDNEFVNLATPLIDTINHLKCRQQITFSSIEEKRKYNERCGEEMKEERKNLNKSIIDCENQINEMKNKGINGEVLDSKISELKELRKSYIKTLSPPIFKYNISRLKKEIKEEIIAYSVLIKLKQWRLINLFIEHILYGCDSEYQNIMKSFKINLDNYYSLKKCHNQLTNKHSQEKLYEFKKENNLINANDEQINEEITTQLNNVNTFFAALFRTEPSFDLIYFAKLISKSLADIDKEISALYSLEDLIDGFMKKNVKKDIIFKIMEFNDISQKEVEQIIQTLFVQKNESLLKPEETTIQSSLIITFVNTEYTINFNNSLNCSNAKVVLEDMSMSVISKIFESEYVKELNITPTGGTKIKIIMDDKIQEEELSQTKQLYITTMYYSLKIQPKMEP